jgi:hypothetical protein
MPQKLLSSLIENNFGMVLIPTIEVSILEIIQYSDGKRLADKNQESAI